MINERIALVMLNGEVGQIPNDPHHTKEFYSSMQTFATSSLKQCEEGNLKKFEECIMVARKLYKDGNETVKNGISNVYLYTLSHALDKQTELKEKIVKLFPKELLEENKRQHYCSGI